MEAKTYISQQRGGRLRGERRGGGGGREGG